VQRPGEELGRDGVAALHGQRQGALAHAGEVLAGHRQADVAHGLLGVGALALIVALVSLQRRGKR